MLFSDRRLLVILTRLVWNMTANFYPFGPTTLKSLNFRLEPLCNTFELQSYNFGLECDWKRSPVVVHEFRTKKPDSIWQRNEVESWQRKLRFSFSFLCQSQCSLSNPIFLSVLLFTVKKKLTAKLVPTDFLIFEKYLLILFFQSLVSWTLFS